ncbi:MAG TPA: DUF3311 domain-containing protein [Marmoricola sp.]|jgi:uncharacterized membrane protein YgcG|nr:DUF3311 domain-containing protein [Marmoricola sp.]
MNLGNGPGPDHEQVPPANKGLLAAAGVLLALPIIGLMWVGSYNQEDPKLWGFPFFFWYQFLWVFLCSAMTWTAYKLVLAARRRPSSGSGTGEGSGTGTGSGPSSGSGAERVDGGDR